MENNVEEVVEDKKVDIEENTEVEEKQEENDIKEKAKKNKKAKKKKVAKTHKKIDIKKGIGKLAALIVVICMLFASSATLIFYLIWYLN